MSTRFVLSVAPVVLSLVACQSSVMLSHRVDAGAPPSADAALGTDAAPSFHDAGLAPSADAGGAPPVADAGPTFPGTDAGDPMPMGGADAGMASVDAGMTSVDASSARDAAAPPGCEVVTDQRGLVFTSTASAPRSYTSFPAFGGRSFHRFEIELDVRVAGWTPKQGQYEVFSLLRGRRWTGYAIGYVSFVGPASRAVVTTANLGLDGAAAPPGGDGRRASASMPVETMHDYHLAYAYDAALGRRRLVVSETSGTVLRTLEGPTFVSSIDVEREGVNLVLGGEEVDGAPDCTTLGWSFSNVRILACP